MAQLFRYDNAFAFGGNMVQHSDNASFLIMSFFLLRAPFQVAGRVALGVELSGF